MKGWAFWGTSIGALVAFTALTNCGSSDGGGGTSHADGGPGGGPAPGPTTSASGDYTLNPGVVVASYGQAIAATVLADRVVFPKPGNESLLSLRAGNVIVGDRNATASTANRYGFARIVAQATDPGDGMIAVITSGDATLEDVYAKAEFASVATLDQFYELPIADGQTEQPPITTKDYAFGSKFSTTFGGTFGPIPIASNLNVAIPWPSENANISVNGSLTLKQVKFLFTPKIDVKVRLGTLSNARLDEFHLIVGGQADIAALFAANIGLTATLAAKTDLAPDVDFAQKLSKFLNTAAAKAGGPLAPTVETPALIDLEFVGPILGVVPTTFEVSLTATCEASVSGGITFEEGAEMTGELDLGAAWTPQTGWTSPSDAKFNYQQIGPGVTAASGTLGAKCGLKPKIAWKLGGAVGPYFAVEGGAQANMTYAEKCPDVPFPSRKPDATFTISMGPYVSASLGGEVKVFGKSLLDANFTLFPPQSTDLYSPTTDFKDNSFGWGCPAIDCNANVAGTVTESGHCNGTAALSGRASLSIDPVLDPTTGKPTSYNYNGTILLVQNNASGNPCDLWGPGGTGGPFTATCDPSGDTPYTFSGSVPNLTPGTQSTFTVSTPIGATTRQLGTGTITFNGSSANIAWSYNGPGWANSPGTDSMTTMFTVTETGATVCPCP
jgi:hypothetical protein